MKSTHFNTLIGISIAWFTITLTAILKSNLTVAAYGFLMSSLMSAFIIGAVCHFEGMNKDRRWTAPYGSDSTLVSALQKRYSNWVNVLNDMVNVTLFSEDFAKLHNTLCQLRSFRQSLTGDSLFTLQAARVDEIIKSFEDSLKSAYE